MKTFRDSFKMEDEKNNESESDSKSESSCSLIIPRNNYQRNNDIIEKIKMENIDYINRKTRELIENSKKNKLICCTNCTNYNNCNKCKNILVGYEKDKKDKNDSEYDFTIKKYPYKYPYKYPFTNLGLFFGGLSIGIGITSLLFYRRLNFKGNK